MDNRKQIMNDFMRTKNHGIANLSDRCERIIKNIDNNLLSKIYLMYKMELAVVEKIEENECHSYFFPSVQMCSNDFWFIRDEEFTKTDFIKYAPILWYINF